MKLLTSTGGDMKGMTKMTEVLRFVNSILIYATCPKVLTAQISLADISVIVRSPNRGIDPADVPDAHRRVLN